MRGWLLRFYVHENDRHGSRLTWEWLLEEANRMGLRGGSAFRAMAGFGRDRVLHENRFFELGGTLTVEVEFLVADEEARRLLEFLEGQNVRLFYSQIEARFGVINPEPSDPTPSG